ncbi:MAG TPA: hypothetical protein VE665_07540 [Hyphomicrobiaceae bacterium]|nr:hypothetical protein [Hyphomicrobiaceae bacterium]
MLFYRDPRWRGGDDAYSIRLGGDSVLWLFGNSFIGGENRRESNSIRKLHRHPAARPGHSRHRISLAAGAVTLRVVWSGPGI